MPILQRDRHNLGVNYPESNYDIARYMDINKFISLISLEKIFYPRVSILEDKFEGTLPDLNKIKVLDWYKSFEDISLVDNKSSEVNSREHIEMVEKYKQFCYISCWSKFDYESYALWKIYSDVNYGILIKTDRDSLIDAFNNAEDNLLLSEVKYIDYANESINDSVLYFPLLYKNKPYSFEKELRILILGDFKTALSEQPPICKGKYINIDINTLIKEIIVSPFAPDWFYQNVKSLMKKYKIIKPLKKSNLTI